MSASLHGSTGGPCGARGSAFVRLRSRSVTSVEIEEIVEEPAPAPPAAVGRPPATQPVQRRALLVLVVVAAPRAAARGPFDQPVELAAGKPDAAALRAVVDLHALTVTQDQPDVTHRTSHGASSTSTVAVRQGAPRRTKAHQGAPRRGAWRNRPLP